MPAPVAKTKTLASIEKVGEAAPDDGMAKRVLEFQRAREQWRDNEVARLTGQAVGTAGVTEEMLDKLTDEQAARVRAICAKVPWLRPPWELRSGFGRPPPGVVKPSAV